MRFSGSIRINGEMKVLRYPKKPRRFTPTMWVVKKAIIARPAVVDRFAVGTANPCPAPGSSPE